MPIQRAWHEAGSDHYELDMSACDGSGRQAASRWAAAGRYAAEEDEADAVAGGAAPAALPPGGAAADGVVAMPARAPAAGAAGAAGAPDKERELDDSVDVSGEVPTPPAQTMQSLRALRDPAASFVIQAVGTSPSGLEHTVAELPQARCPGVPD